MKWLKPRGHGYVDYAAVVATLLAPSLFGFTAEPAALCYALGVFLLGLSLMTAYPISLVKAVPFTVHGGIELATSMFLVIAPWLLGFADVLDARNFFIVAGVGLFLVYLVTDYKAGDRYRRRAPARQERVSSQA